MGLAMVHAAGGNGFCGELCRKDYYQRVRKSREEESLEME